MPTYKPLRQSELDQFRNKERFEIDAEIRDRARIAQQIFHQHKDNPRAAQGHLERIHEDLQELHRIKINDATYSENNYVNQVGLLLHYIDFNIEVTEDKTNWTDNIDLLEHVASTMQTALQGIQAIDAIHFEEKDFDELVSVLKQYEAEALQHKVKIQKLQKRAAEFLHDRDLNDAINRLPSTPLKSAIHYKLPSLEYSVSINAQLKPRFLLLKKWHSNAALILITQNEIDAFVTNGAIPKDAAELKSQSEALAALYMKQQKLIQTQNELIVEGGNLQKQDADIQKKFGHILFDVKNIAQSETPPYNEQNAYALNYRFLNRRLENIQNAIRERVNLANAHHVSQQGIAQTLTALKKVKPELESLQTLEAEILQLMQALQTLQADFSHYAKKAATQPGKDLNKMLSTAHASCMPTQFITMTEKRIKLLTNMQTIEVTLDTKPPLYQRVFNSLYQVLSDNPELQATIITFLSTLDSRQSHYNVRSAILFGGIKFAIGRIRPDLAPALAIDALAEAAQSFRKRPPQFAAPFDGAVEPPPKTNYIVRRLAQAFLAYQAAKHQGKILKVLSMTANLFLYPWLELAQSVFNIQNRYNLWSSYTQIMTISLGILFSGVFLSTVLPFNTLGLLTFIAGVDVMAGVSALVGKKLFEAAVEPTPEAPLKVKQALGTERATNLWRLMLTQKAELQTALQLSEKASDTMQRLSNIQMALERGQKPEEIIASERDFIRLHFQQMRPLLLQLDDQCTSSNSQVLKDLEKQEANSESIKSHLQPVRNIAAAA